MSVLSVVFPVYLAFCIFDATAIGLKLAQMDDPAYRTLAVVALLYVGTLIAQARINAGVTRSVINLRFENMDLIERLNQQSAKAQAAEQQAVDANMAKSRFLAAASHDLRQPIHAQGLFLEVIGREALSANQRSMLDNARASVAASAEMLNTLLDFSRIEAGVIEPQRQAFQIQTLLNKIEGEFAPQAMVKGLVFRVRETSAVAFSDPMLIELILRNLVSNAIRYTERGGCLLACRKCGEELSVEVWDTGIGIDPSQHQAIFREFHQLGNPERDRSKGLGLGLAIADGLVRTLGHQLSLRSLPGKGTVFKLRLPLTTDAVTSAVPVSGEFPVQRLNIHVLVIDDDEAIRTGMQRLLEDWGCRCATAESIEEALAIARQDPPDVVISDYRLRELRTGREAIATLRQELGVNLPALLITGDTAPERLKDAQFSGTPLLHKPVSPALLYAKLVAETVSPRFKRGHDHPPAE